MMKSIMPRALGIGRFPQHPSNIQAISRNGAHPSIHPQYLYISIVHLSHGPTSRLHDYGQPVSASQARSSQQCHRPWAAEGKSPFLMGKSTISMAIFHSCLYVYQRVDENSTHHHPPFGDIWRWIKTWRAPDLPQNPWLFTTPSDQFQPPGSKPCRSFPSPSLGRPVHHFHTYAEVIAILCVCVCDIYIYIYIVILYGAIRYDTVCIILMLILFYVFFNITHSISY